MVYDNLKFNLIFILVSGVEVMRWNFNSKGSLSREKDLKIEREIAFACSYKIPTNNL